MRMKALATVLMAMSTLCSKSGAETPYADFYNTRTEAIKTQLTERKPEILKTDNQIYAMQLTWAWTSPASRFHDDMSMRSLAEQMTDSCCTLLEKRDIQLKILWSTPLAETLKMWSDDKRAKPERFENWLASLLPWVEAGYQRTFEEDDWHNHAPNTLFQQAVMLQLGAALWKTRDAAMSERFATRAKHCIDSGLKYQLPGGAFSYRDDSGPDASYLTGAETMFLCRYYMLTNDDNALAGMKRILEYNNCVSKAGLFPSISSPWWKHINWTGSEGDCSEILLKAGDNPITAFIAERSRARSLCGRNNLSRQNYYNMLCNDAPLPSVKSPPDGTFFDKSGNGPALRYGALNVVMPYRPYCESSAGLTFSSDDKIESWINSVIICAKLPENSPQQYNDVYSIMSNEPALERHVVTGGRWIASFSAFKAELGTSGMEIKNGSPWLRQDLYFANASGMAGLLELTATEGNNCEKVAIWSHVSGNAKPENDRLVMTGLSLKAEPSGGGRFKNLGIPFPSTHIKSQNVVWESVVKDAGGKGFKKGETFKATVAVEVQGQPKISIGRNGERDGILFMEVMSDGKAQTLLLLNKSNSEKVWSPDPSYKRRTQADRDDCHGRNTQIKDERLKLPPHSLNVLEAEE